MYAPIVTFVYNREDHARELFTSLSACDLAKESDLFIFSDGPKSQAGAAKVQAVRDYIHSAGLKDRFRSVTVVEAEQNRGLASSVISGVDRVIRQYGRVIVIEDDNVVSRQMLRFMNMGLDRYEEDKSVWCTSGYSSWDNVVGSGEDVFFSKRPNSYLWGTWKDRWDKVDWQVSDYRRFLFDLRRRRAFNKYGNDASGMLDDQMVGNIDSWAIRYYYSCFCHDGYVVMPNRTFSVNFGNDGSGTHLKKGGPRDERVMDDEPRDWKFPNPYEDERVIRAYNTRVHRKLTYRLFYYVKAGLLGMRNKR